MSIVPALISFFLCLKILMEKKPIILLQLTRLMRSNRIQYYWFNITVLNAKGVIIRVDNSLPVQYITLFETHNYNNSHTISFPCNNASELLAKLLTLYPHIYAKKIRDCIF
jgi:hypothetical protein